MRDFILLFIHVIVTICRLWRPGGARSVIAESILLKQQLLILNRSRKRRQKLASCIPHLSCGYYVNIRRIDAGK
jgi:putative transposase